MGDLLNFSKIPSIPTEWHFHSVKGGISIWSLNKTYEIHFPYFLICLLWTSAIFLYSTLVPKFNFNRIVQWITKSTLKKMYFALLLQKRQRSIFQIVVEMNFCLLIWNFGYLLICWKGLMFEQDWTKLIVVI